MYKVKRLSLRLYIIYNTSILSFNVKFAMFLNISEFVDVGFFDEDFFFYFEEIDLCKRIINIGKKIYLVPEIKIEVIVFCIFL